MKNFSKQKSFSADWSPYLPPDAAVLDPFDLIGIMRLAAYGMVVFRKKTVDAAWGKKPGQVLYEVRGIDYKQKYLDLRRRIDELKERYADKRS